MNYRNEAEANLHSDQWITEPWHLPHMRNRANDAADTVPGFYPPCESGPCARGAKLCSTPEACRLPDESNITFWQMLRAIFFGERK